MFKHALLTAVLVVVASVLGAAATQMNETSQAFVAAHDKLMKSMAMALNTDKEIEQFRKRRTEHM